MTTAQLSTEIWHSMSIIAEDEGLMRRAAKYLRNLAAEKAADTTEMSREDFFARVDKAEKQIANGQCRSFSNAKEMNEWLAAL